MKLSDIGATLGFSAETIRKNLREIEAYQRIAGNPEPPPKSSNNIIYNPIEMITKDERKGEDN
jgi:hypothetical protein